MCVCLNLDIIRGDNILMVMMTTTIIMSATATKTHKSNPISNAFISDLHRSPKLAMRFYAHTERISARRKEKWHNCKFISMTVTLCEKWAICGQFTYFEIPWDVHACIHPSIVCNRHVNSHHAQTHTRVILDECDNRFAHTYVSFKLEFVGKCILLRLEWEENHVHCLLQ